MALQKQTKAFGFIQGIDTKTASEILPIGKLHSAENVRFYQAGKLTKKRGSTKFPITKEITNQDQGGNSLGTVDTPFTHQNGLAAITENNILSGQSYVNGTPQSIYNYSSTTQKWNFTSKAAFCNASSETFNNVDSFGNNALMQDGKSYISSVEYLNIVYSATCFDITGNQVAYCAFDLNTSESINSSIITNAWIPRVVLFNNIIYIIYHDNAGSLKAQAIDPSTSNEINGGIITFFSDMDAAAQLYDCFVSLDGSLYIAYADSSAGVSIKRYVNPIGTSGTPTPQNSASVAQTPSGCIAIFGGPSSGSIYTAFNRATHGLRYISSSTTLSGNTVVVLDSTTDYSAVTGTSIIDRGNLGVIVVAQNKNSAGVSNYGNIISTFLINATTHASTGTSNYPYNLLLASKAFVYNGFNYVIFANADSNERTYYLCVLTLSNVSNDSTSNWLPVAKLLFGEGITTPGTSSVGLGYLGELTTSGSTFYGVFGKYIQYQSNQVKQAIPSLCKFAFTTISKYQFKEIAGNTYFNGGFPTLYDGQNLFEASFLHSPLKPDGVTQSAGGILTLLGSYQFCTVFQYIDANGNRHLSAPSIPSDTITLTGTNQNINFNIYPPSLSYHQNVDVLIYRTQANGTIFYLDSSVLSYINGAPFSAGPGLTDAVLATQETLYTTGDVIENQCPTGAKQLAVWDDRLWALTDDGVVFSKSITDGFPAEFNPVLNLNAAINKSKPTGIAAMRDKFLVFFQDDIYYISGDGPTDTGVGQYTKLELACAGVGYNTVNGIVEAQDQVFFLSRDGWRVITQALEVEYIGAEIQQYFPETQVVNYSIYCDNLHEIRIGNLNGVYCYDLFTKQWFINTSWKDLKGVNWTAVSSTDKKFVRLRNSDAALLYEDSSTYLDDSVFTPALIRTGWISMDQFLGFERLYKIILLGRYQSPHSLTVKLFYDFVPQVVETFTFASSAGNFASFTDTQVYQNDTYAGNGNPMEIALKNAQQKCEAIRIEIIDSFVSGSGQSLDLVGMNLVIGVKNVGYKLRDAATATGTGRPAFVP